jgi:hypothetical protein
MPSANAACGDFWLDATFRINCFSVAEICRAGSIVRKRLRCPVLLPGRCRVPGIDLLKILVVNHLHRAFGCLAKN